MGIDHCLSISSDTDHNRSIWISLTEQWFVMTGRCGDVGWLLRSGCRVAIQVGGIDLAMVCMQWKYEENPA
jgi:hypothetical protein